MNELENNGLTTEQELERNKRWLKDLHIRYNELKKKPSFNFVCSIISECIGNNQEIKINKNGEFYFIGSNYKGKKIQKAITAKKKFEDRIYYLITYPLNAKSIEALGKFYEKKEEKQ